MERIKHLMVLLVILGGIGIGQAQLNEYKYIIIPKKFDAFKEPNKYQTSTLVKHLFSEKGFNAVYDDEMPPDLVTNRCLGLTVDMDDTSSMFTTKIALRLQDCNNKEVFATREGRSKEKDYRLAFNEAIRDAFHTFDTVNYTYSGPVAPVTANYRNDVKRIDNPVRAEAKDVSAPPERARNEVDSRVVVQEATPERQTYKSAEPEASNLVKAVPLTDVARTQGAETLYAQKLPSGYQLVDSTPKILYRLGATTTPGLFIAEGGEKRGVVFNRDGEWVFEYYEGDKLHSETLQIKF